MSHIAKCFRSGNTLRISLHHGLRYALKAQPADYLRFRATSGRGMIVENLSEIERSKQPGRKK